MSLCRLPALLTLVAAGVLAVALPVASGNDKAGPVVEANGVPDGRATTQPGSAEKARRRGRRLRR